MLSTHKVAHAEDIFSYRDYMCQVSKLLYPATQGPGAGGWGPGPDNSNTRFYINLNVLKFGHHHKYFSVDIAFYNYYVTM